MHHTSASLIEREAHISILKGVSGALLPLVTYPPCGEQLVRNGLSGRERRTD